MSGTGNILLKRGTTIPYTHQADEVETSSVLPKAMPAVQIEGLSYTSGYNTTNSGPYARDNYKNRLWMGMYGYGTATAEIASTTEYGAVPFPNDGWQPNSTGSSRPLWMGAEIRAFLPVKDDASDAYHTILKADWNRPSDMVLVTQKAIALAPVRSYALGTLGTVSPNIDTRKYVEFSVPVHDTGADAWTGLLSKKLVLPVAAPIVGDALTVSTVTTITNAAGAALGEQSHTEIVLAWAAAGAGTPSLVTITPSDTAEGPHYLTFTNGAISAAEEIRTDTDLTYNPSTNTLTAVNFAGIASSATVATTVSTSASNTGSAFKIPFTNTTGTDNATVGLLTDSVGTDFTYNPNTNTLIVANLTGNASTATQATSVTAAVSSSISNLPVAFLSAATSTASVLTDPGITYTPSTDMLNITNISKSGTTTAGTQFVLFGTTTNGLQYHSATENIFRFDPGLNGGTLYVNNLVVSGQETISQKTTIDLTDTYIRLNSDLITDPTENGGISLNRGTKASPELRFNESTDRWDIVAPIDNLAISGIALSGSGNSRIFTVTHPSTGTVRRLAAGNTVRITGVSGGNTARYNGVWFISTVPNGTSFTVASKTHKITNMTFQSGGSYLVTVSEAHFPVVVGQQIVISNTTEASLRGTFVVVGSGTLGALANPSTTAFYIAAPGPTAITEQDPSTGGTFTVSLNTNYDTTDINTTSANAHTTVSYPIVHTSASNSSLDAATPIAALSLTSGGQPVQTIYNAKLVDVELNNLTMTGSWQMNASITSTENFNLSKGGLILPYFNYTANSPDPYHELNPNLANLPEGQIVYDITSNRIKYSRGSFSTNSPDISNNTVAELVDTTAAQTLTNKTWNSTVIAGLYGGTGVANSGKTITLGGNLTTSGAFTTTLTATANTSVTLPTSGILYGTATGSITSASLLGSMTDETGSGALVFATSPTFTTSVLSPSGSFDVFNTNATTINAFGAASILIMGHVTTGTTTIRGGTLIGNNEVQNVFNTVATTTVNAFGATATVNIGSTGAGSTTVLGNNLTIKGNNIFFKSTTGNRILLTSADVAATTTHTLPNVTTGNVVIAATTNFGDAGFILTGGVGNSGAAGTTPSLYKDPNLIVVGGVKVNFQNTISSAARYPIPFLGSTRSSDTTDPSAIFSAVSDGSYLDSYLYANMSTATGSAAGTYNNLTSGLFYEVNEIVGGVAGPGTLFCDYIGATLDCGTYA